MIVGRLMVQFDEGVYQGRLLIGCWDMSGFSDLSSTSLS